MISATASIPSSAKALIIEPTSEIKSVYMIANEVPMISAGLRANSYCITGGVDLFTEVSSSTLR